MSNHQDFRNFMIKGAIWVAVICTIVVAACGLIWGSIIEGSLIAEIGKYAVGNLGIIVILETFWYTLGQLLFHWSDEYKEKYGKGWFWKGIKEDLKYIKDNWNWKKFWKVILTYVIFFGVFGLLIFLLG